LFVRRYSTLYIDKIFYCKTKIALI
jgi:hypothetical protein